VRRGRLVGWLISPARRARLHLGPLAGEVGAQNGVIVLKIEHEGDAGEVEAGGQQLADATDSSEVVVAVATGAAIGALRAEQALALVRTEALLADSRQLSGDRDAVYAACRIGTVDHHSLRNSREGCTDLVVVL
jgi:hypothetical protein